MPASRSGGFAPKRRGGGTGSGGAAPRPSGGGAAPSPGGAQGNKPTVSKGTASAPKKMPRRR